MSSIEIDIATGDTAWPAVKPLLSAVWPPEVVKASPWGHIVFAHADLRVMIELDGDVVCHAGIYRRTGTWNGRKVTIGGMGGVATREDCRGRGYATLAINAAIHTLTEERATDFGMLFCEPHNNAFYEKLGWQTFNGPVYAEQPAGRTQFDAMAPYVFKIKRLLREGTIDLCGLPW
ncbi:MAG: GNAT family N-acetyltransferase [Afipia sp.]|nr:GNAT family N-acetyltransferase [Afipia sp.]